MHQNFFKHIEARAPYRSVLCVNGDLPDQEFFDQVDLPIIALDGAANTLMEMGIQPDMVIGDLDSIKPEYVAILPNIRMSNQDQSDFQKGLTYLKEHNLLPAIILGINGGHLDHVLHNINIFQETDNICYAPPLVCYILRNTTQLNLPLHSKISLMGMPSALVSTQGLKWELDHSILQFPGRSSVFNRAAKEEIVIKIHRGTSLVLIYLEAMIDAGLL